MTPAVTTPSGRLGRREWLRNAAGGFGSLALAGLLGTESRADSALHHAPRAKSVIFLYMEGGPSQVDMFDHKPELQKRDGQVLPFAKPATVFNSSNKLMRSPFSFRQYGQSGTWVSELWPHLAECVDDLTFIHSMHHGISNHSAACYLSHTGDPIAGRPSFGSWVTYGLGSENDNLPGFVVLDCGQAPSGGVFTWSNGFLPATHAGTKFNRGEMQLESPDPPEQQRIKLRGILALNRLKQRQTPGDARLEAVISGYEKAARMQRSVPEVMDISNETARTRNLYGLDDKSTQTFGSRCLMARRLVERGVRFMEIFSPRVKADRWDQHGNLKQGHINNCRAVDKPIAGLLRDLKQRGLLDDTIVLWGGEFGRTPTSQGRNGRDHNPFGYTVFLAGGGFQPGLHYGSTDPFGYYATEDRVHLHDLHATLLHQLGIDHERLTYRYDGRDYRLTDVSGNVVRGLIQTADRR